MVRSGIHPRIASERLRPATVAFTLDTNVHVVPGLQEAAARVLDRFLSLRDFEVIITTSYLHLLNITATIFMTDAVASAHSAATCCS